MIDDRVLIHISNKVLSLKLQVKDRSLFSSRAKKGADKYV